MVGVFTRRQDNAKPRAHWGRVPYPYLTGCKPAAAWLQSAYPEIANILTVSLQILAESPD